MNTLAQSTSSDASRHPISWLDYQNSTDSRIAKLDEAIFEMSHLIAALSTVDGAVVLSRRFELLGFRAEIRCDFADIHMIARALDLEGKRFKNESTGGVGTRHRSAYQLCTELKDALVVVISQDGGVRFIRWNEDHVMYWDHHATFAFSQRF
jgi:DNA integrity scanning protein DisA with diadenylate cyclase activity